MKVLNKLFKFLMLAALVVLAGLVIFAVPQIMGSMWWVAATMPMGIAVFIIGYDEMFD